MYNYHLNSGNSLSSIYDICLLNLKWIRVKVSVERSGYKRAVSITGILDNLYYTKCCVFRPAFGCCVHPKAGWTTFFQPFSTFFVLFISNLFQWFYGWNQQKTPEKEQKIFYGLLLRITPATFLQLKFQLKMARFEPWTFQSNTLPTELSWLDIVYLVFKQKQQDLEFYKALATNKQFARHTFPALNL